MPSSKYFIPQFRGLKTNDNVFTTEDGSMLVANNIVLTRSNVVEPRHALFPVFLTTSPTQPAYISTSTRQLTSLYIWNEEGLTAYVVPYTVTAGDDNIGVVYGNELLDIQDYTYEEGKVAATPYPIFKLTAGINWNKPRFVESKNQLFVTASNGVWRTRSDFPSVALNNAFTRADIAFVAKVAVSTNTTSTTTDDARWLLPGKEVAVAVVINKKVSSQQSVTGRFSNIYTVSNTAASSTLAQPGVAVSVVVTPGKFSVVGDSIEIYRSVTYDIGTPAPPLSQFRLAFKLEQSVNAFNNQGAVILVGNDAFLNSDGIPTASSLLESLVPGAAPIIPGVQLPISKDTVTFQNYAWFGNIQRAAFARLQLNSTKSTVLGGSTTLTVDNGNDNGSDLAIQFFGGGIIQANAAVGTLYATTSAALSFVGTLSTANIRVNSSKIGQHATATIAAATNNNGTSVNFVYSAAGSSFDLAKFPASNGIVLVYNNTQSRTETIFTYASLDVTTTPGTTIFRNATYAGGLAWTSTADTYHLWYLPGSSMNTLPVYAGDGTNYYSMLPEPYNIPQAIGTVLNQAASSYTRPSATLLLTLQMLGLTARTEGQLVRDTLKAVADVVNNTSTSNIFMTVNNADQREFVLEAYNPTTSSIAVNLSAAQAAFSPTITTTGGQFTTVSDNMQIINGIIPSAINLPNQASRTFYLSPITVGDSGRQILRLASTTNDFFIFKEREGIYRFNISPGDTYPLGQDIVLVDNTTYLIADESVQEIDESLYFLSQKGFYRLTSTSLTKIDKDIDLDVRKTIAKTDLSLVRSFGNEYRKFYGCFFPDTETDGSGSCFVYDTIQGQWTRWDDVSFEAASLNQIQNKLTTVTKDLKLNTFFTSEATVDTALDTITLADGITPLQDYMIVRFTTTGTLPAGLNLNTNYWIVKQAITLKVATSRANAIAGTFVDITTTGTGVHTATFPPQTTDSIEALGLDPNAFTWQYLRQEVFTGEDVNIVIDNTSTQVVNINGDEVVTADIGSNNPDASVDQYEYRSFVFSSVTNQNGGAWTSVSMPYARFVCSGVTNNSVYKNFEDLASFVFGKQLYLSGSFNGSSGTSSVPVSIVSIEPLNASNVTAITIQFPSYITNYAPSVTTDYLAVGVNAEFQLRPIHANTPNLNKRFSEFAFTTQDFPSTYIASAFAVDTVSGFTENVVFSTVLSEQQIYRCFIPIEASRGRFLRVRMLHSTPGERFAVNGSSIALTGTSSTATTKAAMR
jgi:hypothetical protein